MAEKRLIECTCDECGNEDTIMVPEGEAADCPICGAEIHSHLDEKRYTYYNHGYTIGFELYTLNPSEKVTASELLKALKDRVAQIERDGEILDAAGDPFDTCEEDLDQCLVCGARVIIRSGDKCSACVMDEIEEILEEEDEKRTSR